MKAGNRSNRYNEMLYSMAKEMKYWRRRRENGRRPSMKAIICGGENKRRQLEMKWLKLRK
jgi:hypothetical protein